MMRLPCWNMEGGLEDEIAWLEQGVRISRLDCLLSCVFKLPGRRGQVVLLDSEIVQRG